MYGRTLGRGRCSGSIGYGGFEDAQARDEDGRGVRPGGGGVAFVGGEGRDLVDVNAWGDVEDALDCVWGEGLVGDGVVARHCGAIYYNVELCGIMLVELLSIMANELTD